MARSDHADKRSGPGSQGGQRSETFMVEELGVAFFDLSRMPQWKSSDDDLAVAEFLQKFYALTAKYIEPAGGRIVKFMGDGGLAIFDPDQADSVIFAFSALSDAIHRTTETSGVDTYLNVNIHIGPVVTGEFGVPGHERFDVVGKAVNIAARLGRRGITLSPQAFRALTPQGRERFKKINPPTTYKFDHRKRH